MWEAGLLGQACATLREGFLYPPEHPKSNSPNLTCSKESSPQPSTHLQPSATPSQRCCSPAVAHCPSSDRQPLLGPSFRDPSLLLPAPGLAWGSPLPTTLPPSLASRTHWVLYIVGTQLGIANPKREEVS